jgi:succinoglycan biosynthesis protein ExoA
LRELQESDPRVRILRNPHRSTPIGLNIGLANARGSYIARMDAHTLYPEDYLQRGVARLRRGGADHVSGPQLAHGAGTWSRRVALALDTPLGRGGAQFRQATNGEIEVDSGFTGVWPRPVLEAHSGWNEDWHNDQDSELAARIRGSGGRILCLPEMGAQYIPRDSLRALARQYWRYGVYRAKTSGAHPESMRRSHLLAPSVALSLAAAILPLGGLRRLGRMAVAVWCAVVVGVAMAETWRADSSLEIDATPADVAALPAVFGAMHIAWGFGFLFGCVRFGPPLRALANLVRRPRA